MVIVKKGKAINDHLKSTVATDATQSLSIRENIPLVDQSVATDTLSCYTSQESYPLVVIP